MNGRGLRGEGSDCAAAAFETAFIISRPVDGDDMKMLFQYRIFQEIAAAIPGAGRSMDQQQWRQRIGAARSAKKIYRIIVNGEEKRFPRFVLVIGAQLFFRHYKTAETTA